MRRNKMKYLIRFSFLTLSLIFALMVSLGAQSTIEFEAEDYVYNEDPNSTWLVMDDVGASGGQFISQVQQIRSYNAIGWEFETISATDTIYYIWYYARRPLNSSFDYNRFYVNMDGDTNTVGSSWPFQYFNNLQFQEEAADSVYDWLWYQNHDGAKHDSIYIQPGQHVLYLRHRDPAFCEIDKIKITNDLTWQPDVKYEWEAEAWPLAAPLEVVSEAGASGDLVVATQSGSGTISSIDLLNGNLDVGFRSGRVANADYYLWFLVNLPSEAANSYWIGTGDEGIIPPTGKAQ